MNRKTSWTRRQVLKGAGVSLALPWLETFAPRTAKAQAACQVGVIFHGILSIERLMILITATGDDPSSVGAAMCSQTPSRQCHAPNAAAASIIGVSPRETYDFIASR